MAGRCGLSAGDVVYPSAGCVLKRYLTILELKFEIKKDKYFTILKLKFEIEKDTL